MQLFINLCLQEAIIQEGRKTMWLTDIFKIKELKSKIESLQLENTALMQKLNSLEGENYFSMRGKVSELNNCYDQRLQESQTLSVQIRERFEKTQELDKQIISSQRKLTRIKEMYHSMENAIQNYMNIPLEYDTCKLEDKYLEECERITPSIRLNLENMEIKELHEAYLDKEKMIADLFKQHTAKCATSSNKAIYELLVLSLKAEMQNILYYSKESSLDDCIDAVTKTCHKSLKIACEGNHEMAGTFTKFIGELEYHFIDLITLEYQYCLKKKPVKADTEYQ